MAKKPLPVIDEQTDFRTVSYLREMNSGALEALGKMIVLQGADSKRLAVLMPYETQMRFQEAAFALEQIISALPSRRDWLDPAIERLAKSAISGVSTSGVKR